MQSVSESSNWDVPDPLLGQDHGDASPCSMELTPGILLVGRYRLDEVVGHGGMATVWRGHDERLGRDVAIKVCLPASPEIPRPIPEERLSSALLHPNIVSIFDAGTISSDSAPAGTSFIVMEFVDGTTAHDIAPVPWRRAVSIVRQAAEGLAAAHERGIVHCDVKPGNILLDQRGRVLVADFGIAVPVESDCGDYVHGSPAYVAPERLTGAPADPRVDVYGLGGVLLFLISGKRPSDGGISLPSDCPDELVDVIARARANDARERYIDARAFHFALERLDHVSKSEPESASAATARILRDAPSATEDSQPPIAIRVQRTQNHRNPVRPVRRRHSIQETAAMPSISGRSQRIVQPVSSVVQRRTAFRPHQGWSPPSVVVASIVGILLLLAVVMTLREIVVSNNVNPGTAAASAAFTMPDVQGMTFAAAIDSLSQQGIVVDRVEIVYGPGPTNQVVAQDPPFGAEVSDDQSMTLVVRTDR